MTAKLAIRDLKEGVGMDHIPPGIFNADSAWVQCAVPATHCHGLMVRRAHAVAPLGQRLND